MDFIGGNGDRSLSGSARISAAIENALKSGRAVFFVKTNETGDVCGFAFGNIGSGLETGADYLWLNELHVEPEHRRKKIATEILNFIDGWAKKNGIKYIACVTGEGNKTAINLYEKTGFNLSKTVWLDKEIK
jgi:GNAT superfamily N-acetyltransferase